MNNKKILIIILVIVVLCILCVCIAAGVYWFVLRDSSQPTATAVMNSPVVSGITPAESTPEPSEISSAPIPDVSDVSSDQQTWLVMLYQNGDDEVLEYDIVFDANEAEAAGSGERVTVVTQLDRYWGAYDGDGDWSTAKRFYLTTNDDLHTIYSQEVGDLGEVDMGNPATLTDFAVWAMTSYPADRYVLVMSDHGAGWHGGWSDGDNGNYEGLLMRNIAGALEGITSRTGVEKLDLVAFDACLMSQLESLTMIEPYARIAVASEETIPSIGMAYKAFLSELLQNPAMSPADLGRAMVTTYIDQDERIVNEDARSEFVSEAFNYSGETTPDEVADAMAIDITMTAVNLEALSYLNSALNSLAYEMTFIDQAVIARARSYAQSYYNIYGSDVPPAFIDLGNFASLLVAESGSTNITTAANRLYATLDEVVIAERHGPERPGSTGISIYFPNSMLYQSDYAGYNAYNYSVDHFVEVSQWDDFLAFHYTGTAFEPDYTGPVIPAPGTSLQAPGLGNIDVGTLLSSSQTIQQGTPLHLETDISGENIGYIYFFAGKYFEDTNTFLAIDADFVLAESTKESNGVYYPDWQGGPVHVSIDWTPRIYFINDGAKSEFAVLYPLYYGATRDQNVYAVDGLYTFAESGTQTYAVMSFGGDGWMIEVYSFNPEGGGGPREILPKAGDSFTLLLKAIAMSNDPNAEPEFIEFEGGTLTFGSGNFYWDYYEAEPGQYVAGVGALDLDGNYNLDFVPVVIQ